MKHAQDPKAHSSTRPAKEMSGPTEYFGDSLLNVPAPGGIVYVRPAIVAEHPQLDGLGRNRVHVLRDRITAGLERSSFRSHIPGGDESNCYMSPSRVPPVVREYLGAQSLL